jgi:formylglycine-generating enzyme required for sulfatase activity
VLANDFGLYDLHGNVWEWCLDEWADKYYGAPTNESPRIKIISPDKNKERLLGGGSWLSSPYDCRSATRTKKEADHFRYDIGFRVVLSLTS